MADAIFISYRRDDSEGEAGRLFDDLTRAFGNDAVFMDVAGIKPGVDFRKAIEDNVTGCGVLLAVVGPRWATISNADGTRRLEDPTDFVAIEIASALRRDVPVIPVLVHDAKMPTASLLPESLKSFCYRNSVELSHARWSSDVHLLIEALKSYVTPVSLEPVHANVPVQLPAPHISATAGAPVRKRSSPLMMSVFGTLAAILIVAVVVYALQSPRSTIPSTSPSQAGEKTGSATVSASPIAGLPTGTKKSARSATAADDPGAQSSSAPGLIGTWKRPDAGGNADALGMLVIAGSGNALNVHAYGRCQSPACDWGQQPGTFDGHTIVATFSPAPTGTDISRTAQITAQVVPGGLDVLIQNSFENPDGPRKSTAHPVFVAAK